MALTDNLVFMSDPSLCARSWLKEDRYTLEQRSSYQSVNIHPTSSFLTVSPIPKSNQVIVKHIQALKPLKQVDCRR